MLIKQSIEDSSSFFQSYKNLLNPEFFSYYEHSVILGVIDEFYLKNDSIPTYDVIKSIIKKDSSLSNNTCIDELNNLEDLKVKPSELQHSVELLIPFAKDQIAKNAILSASEQYELKNFDEVYKIFDQSAEKSTINRTDNRNFYFEEKEAENRYKKENIIHEKIPTLIKQIDDKMRGGVSKKELAMFLAPPYRGKSAGLVQIGTNALFTGKNVYHISVEMSLVKLATRYDSCLTGMTFEEISRNTKSFIKKRDEFKSLYKGRLLLEEYPARSLSVKDIEMNMKNLARRYDFIPDLLIVDYVDELKRSGGKDTLTTYAIGDVVAELRGLGTKRNVAIWTATQTTKAGLNKVKLDMDDVADSWEKAKVSDIIIAMCQTKEEEENDRMRFIIVKNRDNKRYSKAINLHTKFDIMRFKEV